MIALDAADVSLGEAVTTKEEAIRRVAGLLAASGVLFFTKRPAGTAAPVPAAT